MSRIIRSAEDKDFKPDPVVNKEWWKEHVRYWKFDRQGVEITCGKLNKCKVSAYDAQCCLMLTQPAL